MSPVFSRVSAAPPPLLHGEVRRSFVCASVAALVGGVGLLAGGGAAGVAAARRRGK